MMRPMVAGLLIIGDLRNLYGYHRSALDHLHREVRAQGWLHLGGETTQILLQLAGIAHAHHLKASILVQAEELRGFDVELMEDLEGYAVKLLRYGKYTSYVAVIEKPEWRIFLMSRQRDISFKRGGSSAALPAHRLNLPVDVIPEPVPFLSLPALLIHIAPPGQGSQ